MDNNTEIIPSDSTKNILLSSSIKIVNNTINNINSTLNNTDNTSSILSNKEISEKQDLDNINNNINGKIITLQSLKDIKYKEI